MSFNVQIKPSGHSMQVENDEFILDAALRHGIAFPYGCRSGVCCTCLGQVVEGEVSYPDGIPLGISENDAEEGRALFCQAVAESDLVLEVAEIEAVNDIEIKTLPVKVASLHNLAPDVMQVLLKLPTTERMQFLAGQYIDILLADNKKRAFSIANAPFDDEYLELHIRHVEGGYFTEQVFNELKEKSLLRIRGPLGSFFLRESDRPKIMMGGGTGFAPIKAMIDQLIEEGNQSPVYLYWGVRSRVDLYREQLAAKWASQFEHIHFIPVLSEPLDEDSWEGETGFVHTVVARDHIDLSGFDIYMSGPPIMIQSGAEAFKKAGASEDHMFSDSFEYSEDALLAINSA